MILTRSCLVVALLAAVTRVAPRGGVPGETTAYPGLPRFDRAACSFKLGAGMVEGRSVRCGYLVVPENRAIAGGPVIRLAVAIFKSRSATPAPDPVIILGGGPGLAVLGPTGSGITASFTPPILRDHDLILLDQRGTGYSQPPLGCPEVDAAFAQILDQRLSLEQAAGSEAVAARQCHDRLERAGINPNDYTTLENAADVADLRLALGYKEVNLYGDSYGTRLALTMMRDFPTGIRGVVLDGVVPPQFNLLTAPASGALRAFDLLFAECRHSRCNRAYPHLRHVLYALVARLNEHPATTKAWSATDRRYVPILLTGNRLIWLLRALLYSAETIRYIPQIIYAVQAGGYYIFNSDTITDHNMNLGMTYAVECSDDAPFVTRARVVDAYQNLPPALRRGLLADGLNLYAICRLWGAAPTSGAQRAPVTSAIPTLILSGANDPITPPVYGALAARSLSHSFHLVFPGLGHGVAFSDPCPTGIMTAFLRNPSHEPDARCIGRMAPPSFVVPGGVAYNKAPPVGAVVGPGSDGSLLHGAGQGLRGGGGGGGLFVLGSDGVP